MAISIDKDLIRDSLVQEQYAGNGQLTFLQIDRSFFVQGLPATQGGDVSVTNAAMDQVKLQFAPVNTPHPIRTEATARGYRFEPAATSTGGFVIVSYLYQGGGYIPTEYTVEMTGGLEQTTTDSEFSTDKLGETSLVPIRVGYIREWAKAGTQQPQDGTVLYATPSDMPVLRPIGGIRIIKSVSQLQAQQIEDARDTYLGYTNSTTFRNKPANTYLCSSIVTTSQPYLGQYIATAQFDYRALTWDQWARFSNTQLGVPTNIWRDTSDDYTQHKSNGYKRCKAYPRTDFQGLLDLFTKPAIQTFGQ